MLGTDDDPTDLATVERLYDQVAALPPGADAIDRDGALWLLRALGEELRKRDDRQ